jgi:hypothetical protein
MINLHIHWSTFVFLLLMIALFINAFAVNCYKHGYFKQWAKQILPTLDHREQQRITRHFNRVERIKNIFQIFKI